MHAYNRVPSSGQSSPSAPSSPRLRSKPAPRFPAPKTLPQHLASNFLSLLLRRQGIFLFAPLIYISAVLFYINTLDFHNLPPPHYAPPGSVYRSPQLYANVRPQMDSDNSNADAISTIWRNSYKGGEWRPCIDKSSRGLPESNGYIYIEANGGLNQQRTSICNAVAVAGYLNATLIIPHFHFHSIWRDPSKFSDIYDEEFFVKTLANDVRVVNKVPGLIMERFDHNMTNVYNFRIKALSSVSYYRGTVLPKMVEEQIIRISPFANRLSFDAPPAVQRLRCLANYEALRFSNPILSLGQTLVARMKDRSANNSGKYISVHLRFEEDMVAFSCCIYDGGDKERIDMDAARERGWRGKFTKRGKVIHPGAIRINGKCPLTPLECRIIRISPFANRLSFDAPPAVQRLRCLANYEALRFSNPILSLGQTLVARMKDRSANNSGKYISVHLRFEEDMVAFSCCIYDGGDKERIDMDAARERGWRGKFTKRGKVIHPGAIRINGKCPLTPLEVGLMLRGMGFGKSSSIYLASGKIYDSERHMKPLLEMFPLLQTKEMLTSHEELAPFQNYSSRMAAIDYTVCLHSEVFVTTQGGNFPHFLLGHRRFLYGGHSRTIRPDKRKLALLYDNPNIGWKSFKRQMLNVRAHSDSKGIEIKRPSDSVYSVPCPDCMRRSNKTEVLKSSLAT